MENIDFISQGPLLSIQKETKIKSWFGGILSFIICTGILLFTWFLGNPIIYKNRPELLIQQDTMDDLKSYNLSAKNSFFAMSFLTTSGDHHPKFLDSVNITAVFWKSVVNEEENNDDYFHNEIISLNLIPCNSNHNKDNYFSEAELQSMLCLPEDYDLDFLGDFTERAVNFLYYEVKLCQNTTDRVCPPIEEMKEAIDFGYYLYFHLKDYYIDTKNYTHPYKTRYSVIYSRINFELYKEVEVFLGRLELNTDKGLVTEDHDIQTNFQFNKRLQDFSLNTNGVIATVWVYINKDITYYTRRYLKIQELGASIGGIFKFFLLFCMIVNYVFNKFNMNLKLINMIYNFEESIFNEDNLRIKLANKDFSRVSENNESKLQVSSFKNEQIGVLRSHNINNSTSKFDLMKNTLNPSILKKTLVQKNIEIIEEIRKDLAENQIKPNLIKLKFSRIDKFLFTFSCKKFFSKELKNKAFLFKTLSKKAEDYYDIEKTVENDLNLKLLKYLTLNENQLEVFKEMSNINLSVRRNLKSKLFLGNLNLFGEEFGKENNKNKCKSLVKQNFLKDYLQKYSNINNERELNIIDLKIADSVI